MPPIHALEALRKDREATTLDEWKARNATNNGKPWRAELGAPHPLRRRSDVPKTLTGRRVFVICLAATLVFSVLYEFGVVRAIAESMVGPW